MAWVITLRTKARLILGGISEAVDELGINYVVEALIVDKRAESLTCDIAFAISRKDFIRIGLCGERRTSSCSGVC